MAILTVDNISKTYGHIRALNNVSFSVPAGTVFGILGPNGSGKTTLLGIIMDVLRATQGSYTWNGQKGSNEQRRKIGTLLETPNFYPYLSAESNLKIAAEIKGQGLEDIPKVLQAVNLYQRRKSKFNTYSLGMKQRLAIASSLLGDPDILVFDEPTNGLDPAGIAEIRDLIQELNRNGKTIIMASHILDEVEKVCTHVAIIQKGDLKMVGSVGEVLSGSSIKAKIIEVASHDLAVLENVLRQMKGVLNVNLSENRLLITCEENMSAEQLNKYCFEKGIILSRLNLKTKSLETRFLEITGSQSDR
ncbi:MAG: ATP-binding cassette domain-containing protein [Ferruginibacter sp.]